MTKEEFLKDPIVKELMINYSTCVDLYRRENKLTGRSDSEVQLKVFDSFEKAFKSAEYIKSQEHKKEWEITGFRETITGDTFYKKIILSVMRLSDGVEFKIGDSVKNPAGHKFTISKFYLDCNDNHMLCNGKNTGNGHVSITKITKCEELFTTEDGVDIFEGDTHYPVSDDFKLLITNFAIKEDEHARSFSTPERAKDYIIQNKPCLSLKDITSNSSTVPGYIFGKLDQYTIDLPVLMELIKQKTGI